MEIIEVSPHIRESYINTISSIIPFDEIEQQDIAETLGWLKTANALNKPYNVTEHLGVLAIVLSPDKTQTFLLQHRKAGLWLPPGGHVDLGQTLQESVLVELKEELGLAHANFITDDPVFHVRTLTQGINEGHTDVTFWFVTKGNPEHQYQIQQKEASAGRWVSIEELLRTPELSNLHRGFQKMKKMGRCE